MASGGRQEATAAGLGQECPVCVVPMKRSGDALSCDACRLDFTELLGGVLGRRADHEALSYPGRGNELTMQVEDRSFWFQHRNRVLASVLLRRPPAGPIWDVGGGNGFPALHLQAQGLKVVMVEPGPVGCENARARGVRTVIRSSLEGLSLPAAAVSAVTCLDVLEHLEEPRGMLREIQRILARDGRLLVTVPALQFLWSDEDIFAEHRRRYTAKTLQRELEENGFRVEYLTYYFQPLLAPVFLLRTLPYWVSRRQSSSADDSMDQSEHRASGVQGRILERLLAREFRRLSRGARLRFGTSLLALAIPD